MILYMLVILMVFWNFEILSVASLWSLLIPSLHTPDRKKCKVKPHCFNCERWLVGRQKKMRVSTGAMEDLGSASKKLQKQEAEERRLSEMMIPKKKRRLYNKIMHSRKKKKQEVSHCEDRGNPALEYSW